MQPIAPKALSKGEAIGLISPSSHCPNPDRIEKAVVYLEKCGYRVQPARHLNRIAVDPATADREKLEDLHTMFADPGIRAIVCLRGGAGASRLLQKIDYELIARNPKILIGYSDITALSLAVYARTGLICFSGPMLATELFEPSAYTEEHFWNMLTDPAYPQQLLNHPAHTLSCLKEGAAEGRMLGGNLSVLSSMIGTPYLPALEGNLLFLEDINEPSWRIDRMLAHLSNAGLLDRCHGLLLGQFDDGSGMAASETSRLKRIFDYYVHEAGMLQSAMQGLSYGHVKELMTMPVGARCRMRIDSEGTFQLYACEAVVHN